MRNCICANRVIIVLITLSLLTGCQSTPEKSAETTRIAETAAQPPEKNKTAPAPKDKARLAQLAPGETAVVFDGESLGQWKIANFAGTGKVHVTDGSIIMEQGSDMSGIVWTGSIIPINYEIFLEARRVDGDDFFCGLTFPVSKSFCSFICGGWGGVVCGLSNLDYFDAANNETTRFVTFQQNRWYSVRVRISEKKIEAWIDDEKMVNAVTVDRTIDVRYEIEPCRPLGVATWQTTGAVRNVIIRRLTPDEVKSINDSLDGDYP